MSEAGEPDVEKPDVEKSEEKTPTQEQPPIVEKEKNEEPVQKEEQELAPEPEPEPEISVDQEPSESIAKLEDEEMPTYISVSSPSMERKVVPEAEEKERSPSPEQNETREQEDVDDDDDSVRVLSSDDEDEEPPYDDDDDVSDDEDDDGEDDEEYQNIYHKMMQFKNMGDGDERDEVDEDEDDDDDDEDACDFDREGFDGGSDDLVLRQSNGRTNSHKKRSKSLQDLSLIKTESSKGAQSYNPFNSKNVAPQGNPPVNNAERRKPFMKYSHVESKVKKYIKDLSEQQRLSKERRRSETEINRREKGTPDPLQTRKESEEVINTCRNIRDYTEKGMKELEVDEYSQDEVTYASLRPVENGSNQSYPKISSKYREEDSEENDVDMDVDQLSEDERFNDRMEKINGTSQVPNPKHMSHGRRGLLRFEEPNGKGPFNGEETPQFCNLRSLSYEEYMSSGPNNNQLTEINECTLMPIVKKKVAKRDDDEVTCTLQIESIRSGPQVLEKFQEADPAPEETKTTISRSTETLPVINHEALALRAELDQRNAQFNGLRDIYQKTASENISLKQELENMKKLLQQYQKEKKEKPETKVIAVQTEKPVEAVPNIVITSSKKETAPKLGGSIVSGSSNEQWTDSTASATISEDPPNLSSILSTDESYRGNGSNRAMNPFSRAFVTSSRILQTLSQITRGKSKTDVRDQPWVSEESIPVTNTTTNSKKRKAAEMSEPSGSSQPFKIPNISKTGWRRRNQPVNPSEMGLADEEAEARPESAQGSHKEVQEDEENDDQIKFFVYPEDENNKEQSFLIQAKEPKDFVKPGQVRECGPYLLGNVEVWMSEMNGTINIWGKELSQESINKRAETKTWQSTPRPRLLSTSSRKSRDFQRNPRCSYSAKTSPIKCDDSKQSSCHLNVSSLNCSMNCSSPSHLPWPACHRNHSCCSTFSRFNEHQCNCSCQERHGNSSCCSDRKFVSCGSNISCSPKHNCSNHNAQFVNSGPYQCSHSNNTSARQQAYDSDDDAEDDEEGDEKLHHIPEQYFARSHPNTCNSRCSDKNNSELNPGPSQQFDEDSFNMLRDNPEVIEQLQKRRRSGKKVRGLLMDLLRGCKDCRTPNTSHKSHQSSVYKQNSSPQSKSTCSQMHTSCLNSCNADNDCREQCDQCDNVSGIEDQLERFRIEMEKLRTRSDSLREMINTLCNADAK